jgi:hypothetical protein
VVQRKLAGGCGMATGTVMGLSTSSKKNFPGKIWSDRECPTNRVRIYAP